MTDNEFKTAIKGLTVKQKNVMGMVAMNRDGGHHPKTLAVLVERGLIDEYDERLGGRGERFPITIKRYEMPIHVHIPFCRWCSTNFPMPKPRKQKKR